LRRATLRFVMPFCLSVRLYATIRLLWGGFLWSLIFEDLQVYVTKIHVSLKSDKNNGTLHEDLCTFMIITRLILLRMRNISQSYVKEKNHDTHFMFNTFFRKVCCFCETMCKNMVEPDRQNMTR
jgi:hypothetical protein